MANQVEILLPAGTKFVTVGSLPKLIATALYPPIADEPTLHDVLKHVSGGQAVKLTEAEQEQLDKIFIELPPIKSGIRKSQWPEYAFTFVHAVEKPDWEVVPAWRDPVLDVVMLRTDAVHQHKRSLADAIANGRIITRTHAMLPLAQNDAPSQDARILLSDLQPYLAELGLNVRVKESPDCRPVTPAEVQQGGFPPSVKRAVIQEREILSVLVALGLDPQRLPRTAPGKSGVRSNARSQVRMSDRVFNKAWDRLRASGQISDAPA